MKSNLDNLLVTDPPAEWTLEDANNCYGLSDWGLGYFGISECGNVTINSKDGLSRIEIRQIVDDLKKNGLQLPLLLRVENILADRIRELHSAFNAAINRVGYQGGFRGVYPLKVNHQSDVVEQVVKNIKPYGMGLEVGSKAELLLAMSLIENHDSLIVCNGYKDRAYVDLGLQLIRLGYQCFFVVENLNELDLIFERAAFWQIDPALGVRIKLATRVDGHWKNGSGDHSLFGMTTTHLIEFVDRLRQSGRLGCLRMLHFHLGSQLPNIENIRDGIAEGCRYYVELVQEGVPLEYLDLGGGLAVDYDGSSTNRVNSCNYDLNEYCNSVVETLAVSFADAGIEHPTILTESGRWIVAPASILLSDVITVDRFDPTSLIPTEEVDWSSKSISKLKGALDQIESDSLDRTRLQEHYHSAKYYLEKARQEFRIGLTSLREKAVAEELCLEILGQIVSMIEEMEDAPTELRSIHESLADIYFCNFSLFRSLPDTWAIGQIFPVLPIHRLDERPTRNGVIADLTCDTDGKIDRFGNRSGEHKTLLLHGTTDEEYVLGLFLVGAYQETLGNCHNLFGDTDVATVKVGENGSVEYSYQIKGDSVSDVLRVAHFDSSKLIKRFEGLVLSGIESGQITAEQRECMLKLFNESITGLTYFESDK